MNKNGITDTKKAIHWLLIAAAIIFALPLAAQHVDQIDAGIFVADKPGKKAEVRIRPNYFIAANRTLSSILYTVRWSDPTITSISTTAFSPFWVNKIGSVVEHNGYFYQTFGSVSFTPIGTALPAGEERVISEFTFTGGGSEVFFELINDDWTNATNGDLYFADVGRDVTGVFYEPFAYFFDQSSIKVFLEGLYNPSTGIMNKTMDYDPIEDEFFEKFGGTVVDLITIELHDAQDFGTPVYVFADVELNATGTAAFNISGVSPGQYYLFVKHRNHMETVSAQPVELPSAAQYDFTTNANMAYGSNQTSLAAGVYGLFAGEIVKDGRIDVLDRDFIQTEILKLTKGYLPEDINGDGVITVIDREIVQSNIIRIIIISTP